MKRVFRYLCGTNGYGLCYQGRRGIREYLQVAMCLTYSEVQLVG